MASNPAVLTPPLIAAGLPMNFIILASSASEARRPPKRATRSGPENSEAQDFGGKGGSEGITRKKKRKKSEI